MGALKGPISACRYQVMGELPDGYTETFTAQLNEHAFRDALSAAHKEERLGWVQVHNLLDTEFDDINRWMYQQYAVFSLRVDKKKLPTKLFQATLQKRLESWCKANNRERPPFNIKQQVREALELEMLERTLPSVQVTDVQWNLVEGWLLFHSQSEAINDNFRKVFHRTFGYILRPEGPLDILGDQPEMASRLLGSGSTDLTIGAQ